VSLILDALRKLEREKQTPEKGFVVLTAAAAPTAVPRWRRAFAAAATFGVLALVAAVLAPRLLAPPPASVTPGPAAAAPNTPSQTATPAASQPATSILAVSPPPAVVPSSIHPPAETPALEVPAVSQVGHGSGPAVQMAPASAAPPAAPAVAPSAPPLVLEAIAERDGHRVAVLNGRLVREGDVFGNTRVLHIGADEVEIETDGRRQVLRF